ncbi:MAG: Na+/H+ antiporter NhaA [Nocardioidaceae bacterium]
MSHDAAPPSGRRRRLFGRLEPGEETFLGRALRQETVGGALLLCAALIALIWANTPWHDAYEDLRHFELGPLTLEEWASDGGLAVFFYVAGLELKRELVVGTLRRPADALVPVAAAIAGMAAPALIYVAINAGGDLDGWAIPTATDIAFALAVLAVIGRSLPSSLRAFLLTLAVVDDLGAILVIAVFFTSGVEFGPLAGAFSLLAVYWWCQRRRIDEWILLLPLGIVTWWLVLESGIHATVAGVALGLLTRVHPDPGEARSPVEVHEHRVRPIAAGIAVPAFALLSAGVSIELGSELLTEPIVLGIALGLLVGKAVGVFAGSYLTARFTHAELAPDLAWRDIAAVAVLAGVGFTVSLLLADLSFSGEQADHATAAVLIGSLASAIVASGLLMRRNRAHAP